MMTLPRSPGSCQAECGCCGGSGRVPDGPDGDDFCPCCQPIQDVIVQLLAAEDALHNALTAVEGRPYREWKHLHRQLSEVAATIRGLTMAAGKEGGE